MRILRFDLTAYGPFTGRSLEFSTELPGLHLIHGPNEAGKSSALRGLRAWLFGFPEQTADRFLHPYDQLLVGGLLEGDDGRRLAFQRRKRRRADLLDPAGQPMDPAELAAMLHNMLPAVFDSLHGLDHDRLVRGGEEILEQEGALGQALFAAGAGLTTLRGLLAALVEEADGLFKARGQRQEINQLLAEHENIRRRIRQESISAPVFQELRERLETSRRELDAVEEERTGLERRKQGLERLRQALPLLAQRRRLCERLATLGSGPRLPEDFSRRRREIEDSLRELAALREDGARQLAEISGRIAAIKLPRPLLAQSGRIDELVQRLGSHRKARADRGTIIGLRSADRAEAEALLRQLRPDLSLEQAEELRPLLSRRRVIEELTTQHAALSLDRQQAERLRRRCRREADTAREQLAALDAAEELSPWRAGVAMAAAAGDLDQVLCRLTAQEAEERARWTGDLASLGLWQGTPEAALGLPLPLPETLREADGALQELLRRRRLVHDRAGQTRDALSRLAVELSELMAAGTVPTEEDVLAARRERDRGWELIRRSWLDQEDVTEECRRYDPARPLHKAYGERVTAADEAADRLRREADRAQRAARLLGEQREWQALLRTLREEDHQLEQELTQQEEGWRQCWSVAGMNPRGPSEMLAWLGDFRELRQRAGELERLAREIAGRRKEKKRARDTLLELLGDGGRTGPPAGEGLAPLLARAREELSRKEAKAQQRQRLHERLHELAGQLDELREEERVREAALEDWQRLWCEQTGPLSVGRTLAPIEAGETLELLGKCLHKLDQIKGHEKRLQGIDRDALALEDEVARLGRELLPETGERDCEYLIPRLRELLAEARKAESREQELRHREAELTEALRQNELAHNLRQAELTALRRLAACGADESLDEAEARHDDRAALQRRLEECETALLENGGGLGIEEFEAQAGDIAPEALPEQIEHCERVLRTDLLPRSRQLAESCGKLQQELEELRGRHGAAGLAAEEASLRATMRQRFRHYLLLRAGSAVLAREIERYRMEHQAPLLSLASDFFRQLTREAFQGLRADEDESGRPVLVGIRARDEAPGPMVAVTQMSSGTRDQLYLALRLAALSHRLDTEEAMPFIVDDILINFDDERSLATLEVLSHLASRMQIILFTHHQRLWQQTEELRRAAPDRILSHRLVPSSR